ncbi:MAG: glycoside hydrolase family 5 protein, partial [Treponema sp.]|nr:glycoside hydrolase family 5 protein [Treponema sp.]
MKKIIFSAIFIMLISCNTTEPTEPTFDEFLVDTGFATPALVSAPFSKGVNFSGWFESYSAHGIPFTMYTEKDFADAKSLGVDVVRVPVRMHSMTLGAPDYILDPLFLRFLDIAVDWAEKYDLYIIIDNHSFDPVQTTSPDIDKILLPVWAQIAQRYKNRSDYVVYEILNEPHGISDERWGEIQGMAIDTIRQYDANRLIIVGGTSYNSIEKLHAIPMYEDKNLIYTFHFYDPYLFTHQGSNWGGPPLLSTLAGLPFPGNARRIPSIPADLRGTWVESSIRHSYEGDANPAVLSQKLDIATAFSRARGVPVFCGEFGVFMVNSYQEDRVRWYSYVTSALNKRNISWTSWDYYGGFGLFNPGGRSFNHDLNVGVARALGFTPPAQIPRTDEPLNTGFVIFDDYPNHQYVSAGNWGENVDFSLYDQNAAKGDFS